MQNSVRREIWVLIGLSLFFTQLIGSIYRIQFYGVHWEWIHQFQLRQGHSHLGFYGALIPMTWAVLLRGHGTLDHFRRYLRAYFLITFVSIGAFLLEGYSIWSRVFSFLVMLGWGGVFFYFPNGSSLENKKKRFYLMGWVYSFVYLMGAIIFAKILGIALPMEWVRGFLFVILLTLVLPVILMEFHASLNIYRWSLAVFLGCFTFWSADSTVGRIGFFLIGLEILLAVIKMTGIFWVIRTLFCGLALGFLLSPLLSIAIEPLIGIALLHGFIFLALLLPFFWLSPLKKLFGLNVFLNFAFFLEMLWLSWKPEAIDMHLYIAITGCLLSLLTLFQLTQLFPFHSFYLRPISNVGFLFLKKEKSYAK